MSRKQVDYDGKIIEQESKLLSSKLMDERLKELLSQRNWEIKSFVKTKNGIEITIVQRLDEGKQEERNYHIFNATIRDESRNEYEKKIQLGNRNPKEYDSNNTIILGFYVIKEDENLENIIFVGYPIDENINYPTNPSIRKTFVNDILQNARINGFYVDESSKYVGFTSEFIYYYLDNFTKLHGYEDSSEDDSTKTEESLQNINCFNLKYNIQRLYFGAPGTGKSYGVTKLISECYPDIDEKKNPFVFKTTVYSDYSYYNFVGNIMPTSKDGEIGYDFKAGIFTRALIKALKNEDKEVFLVVEEMSRTDIASVFGDIFQLLDRDSDGNSEYSINNELILHFFKENNISDTKVSLPRNLHIIGTVNTSDQNVNVIDTAFKRRFGFIYMDVDPVFKKDKDSNFVLEKDENGQNVKVYDNSYTFELIDGRKFEWNKFYMSLNEFITEKLGLSEDKQLGQFFIKFNNVKTEQECYEEIQNKLLHYLWEDVQNAAISEEYSIFNKAKYTTFSKLYKGFKVKENVFSEDFLIIYDKTRL